jgi:hypothetical protein
MPNWVSNELTVSFGDDEDMDMTSLQRFKEKVRAPDQHGEVTVLSADAILPYPEKFKEQDRLSDEAEKKYDKEMADAGWDRMSKRQQNKWSEDHPFVRVPDGFNSGGHEWQIANWGCKWGFANPELVYENEEELQYSFDTAWSPPRQLIDAMQDQFPDLIFSLDYEESGMGFAGTYCLGEDTERPLTLQNEEELEAAQSSDDVSELDELAEFDDSEVRIAVSENSNTSEETLKKLVKDDDEKVSKAANEALSKRILGYETPKEKDVREFEERRAQWARRSTMDNHPNLDYKKLQNKLGMDEEVGKKFPINWNNMALDGIVLTIDLTDEAIRKYINVSLTPNDIIMDRYNNEIKIWWTSHALDGNVSAKDLSAVVEFFKSSPYVEWVHEDATYQKLEIKEGIIIGDVLTTRNVAGASKGTVKTAAQFTIEMPVNEVAYVVTDLNTKEKSKYTSKDEVKQFFLGRPNSDMGFIGQAIEAMYPGSGAMQVTAGQDINKVLSQPGKKYDDARDQVIEEKATVIDTMVVEAGEIIVQGMAKCLQCGKPIDDKYRYCYDCSYVKELKDTGKTLSPKRNKKQVQTFVDNYYDKEPEEKIEELHLGRE